MEEELCADGVFGVVDGRGGGQNTMLLGDSRVWRVYGGKYFFNESSGCPITEAHVSRPPLSLLSGMPSDETEGFLIPPASQRRVLRSG